MVAATAPLVDLRRPFRFEHVAGARCRDGRPAGFGYSLSPGAGRVLIYLEGGGACFNAACPLTQVELPFVPPGDGVFDRFNPSNPFRDAHLVYVPYCTGDVHAGDAEDVKVPGLLGRQQFVGYRNLGLFLERWVSMFRAAHQVVLTGVSAGGFGAALNYPRVKRAFAPAEVVLLDDSGPPMRDDIIGSCLQRRWRELWGLDRTALAECGSACRDPDRWVHDLGGYLADVAAPGQWGLISTTGDAVIRAFYGMDARDCRGGLPATGRRDYARALFQLRREYANFATFYARGPGHTCLRGPCFSLAREGGQALTGWVSRLLEGRARHVGPRF